MCVSDIVTFKYLFIYLPYTYRDGTRMWPASAAFTRDGRAHINCSRSSKLYLLPSPVIVKSFEFNVH